MPDPMASAIDTWGIGFYEWRHAEGTFTSSPRFSELYGVSPATPGTVPDWTRVHPDDRSSTAAALRRAMNPEGDGRLNLVHRVVHPGGKVLWLHHRAQTRFHQVGGGLRPFVTSGSVMDVTERQQIEQELRRSESRIEEAVRGAQFGIFEHNHLEDPEAEHCYWSPRFREMLGASEHEPGSMTFILSGVPAEDVEALHPAVARAHDPAGDGYYDVEHRYVHPTLGVRWLLTRSSTYFGEVGGAPRPDPYRRRGPGHHRAAQDRARAAAAVGDPRRDQRLRRDGRARRPADVPESRRPRAAGHRRQR